MRTAVDNDGTLDKESTSYNDIFDAFRLALKFYHFQERIDYWVKQKPGAFYVCYNIWCQMGAEENMQLMKTLDDAWNSQDWDTFSK